MVNCILTYFPVRSYSRKGPNKDDEDIERLAASIDPGLRLGDYPVLPWRSAQGLRPNGWWDDQDRRDKETPVSNYTFFLETGNSLATSAHII